MKTDVRGIPVEGKYSHFNRAARLVDVVIQGGDAHGCGQGSRVRMAVERDRLGRNAVNELAVLGDAHAHAERVEVRALFVLPCRVRVKEAASPSVTDSRSASIRTPCASFKIVMNDELGLPTRYWGAVPQSPGTVSQ